MDRRLGFGLIFLFAFFYSLSASAAVTLYVSGTDSTCGGNAPCFTTIQDAIDAARPQNIIRIQPGTYRESLSIKDKNSFSGAVELDRIVIEADPLALPGTVILTNKAICDNDADGDQEGDGDADESSSIIKIVHSQFITIRGLTLTGAGSSAIRLSGSRNQGIHIERNRIFRNGTESCGDAIRVLTGNPDTVIVNNLIYGNRRNAIAFRATNGGPHYVIANTIYGNEWNGITVGRNHQVLIANNIINGNGMARETAGGRFGIRREESSNPQPQDIRLLHNLVCGNRLGEINGPVLDPADSGNITPEGKEGFGVSALPGCEVSGKLFANLNGADTLPETADDDFTLLAGSPAIDQGMDLRTLGLDPLFNPVFEADFHAAAIRPADGNADRKVIFDAGAFEFPNQRPLADAGLDKTAYRGTLVGLNGSNSRDPEGATLTYHWSLLSQPQGSQINLSNPTSVNPQFTPLLLGNYLFHLIVNDGEWESAPDRVQINVVNRPPTADAGGPYRGQLKNPIQFDGSGSDPDGDAVTFAWSFGDGQTASVLAPTHTYNTPGDFPVTLTVTDSLGASTISPTIASITAALVLNPIGNRTINLGETLTFTVIASNPDGAPVSLFVSPLPLPNHATFNAATGLFTFTPDTTQVGSFPLTFIATSGDRTASETITVTVPSPPAGGLTSVRGRIYNLNNKPLGTVKVTLKSSGHTGFSSTDGFFTISGVPSGRQELIINGRQANLGVFAILAVPVDLIAGVLNNLPSPITLPDVDLAAEVQVNPAATTVVTNPNVPGVILTIASNSARNPDGTPFTEKLSINPVPDYGRPESRPEELRPGMAITIQPAGVRFNPPARLTFPNADGMPPGNELNLWSLSPDTGTFSIVGKGMVSANGESIVTVEGGVTASAWHFPLAPSGSTDTSVDEGESVDQAQDPTMQCSAEASSTVALHNGCLGTEFVTPSYRSLGVSRALKFVYKSTRANPQPVIPFNATIPVRAAVPPKVSHSLSVGGVEQGSETYINTSDLNEDRDETIRAVASFTARQLKTGVYPYRIKLTSNYLNSAISSFIPGRVLVVNEQASPFGAGWGIEGLAKLHFNSDGTLVLTDGSGTALFFAGGPNIFSAPRGDFSLLVKNPDGTFTRTLKNGTKINFNPQGLQTSVVDRNGNSTSYGYDGSGRLTSIADPVGLITTFTYAGSFLSSVSDPAERKTTFSHDAAGNLTRVTFPNASFRSFGYDSRNLVVSETNERGFVAQREYDSLGRLVRATLPDGSVRTAANAQMIGFADLSTGLGKITNPAPAVRPADALSRYADGNGNQQTLKVGKLGVPLRITDALGQTTLIERRSGNEGVSQNGATFAAGRVGRAFSFDGVDDFISGSTTSGLPLGNSPRTITAWIRSSSTASDRNVFHYGVSNGNLPPTNFHLYVNTKGRAAVGNGFGLGVTVGKTFVDDDRIHFIAGVYEGPTTNIARIYVDGVEEGSTIITTPGTLSGTWSMGRFLGGGAPFSGFIDEVQSYNRALTASEIQALFTAGNVGNRISPPPGLVGWWQGEGNAVDSVSGDGLPTRITRPNGSVTTMSYDSRGNLSALTDPIGALTEFSYEPTFNQVTSIRDPRGNITNISYDAKGNPSEIRDALNNRSQMTYDSRGLLTSVTSGVGTTMQNTTSFTYDVRGNLITTNDPRNNVTMLAYDNAGNINRSTDAEGRITEFAYDPMNRLIRVLDPDGQQTNYGYDPKGNLTQVIDAKNQTTTFTYDQRDRLSSSTNPFGFSESFAYDGNGNLTHTTNRNGQSITFNYDPLNRLISKSRPPSSTEVGPQVTTFGYDSVGNLTSVADPDSTVTNLYDLANRLTSTTASMLSMPARTISYGYDLNGNRTTMTGPQGGLTNYVYDSLNRLTSVRDPSSRTTSFAYDALGRRTSMTHANGIVTSYNYDTASQLTRLAHQLGTTTINSFDYTYDKIGNRKTKVDLNNGTYNYTYDTLNRLTQAVNPLPSNPLESYTYDAVGNRTSSNQNGLSVFNLANQLTEDASFTYQYDNNGNLTRKATKVGGAFTNYEYDAENKLVRVVNNGTTINYKYDGLGRRIEKEIIQVGSKISRYVYDSEDILFEVDGSNNIVARYTHGPGIDEPLILEKGVENFFYHADGLGSITELTNQSGTLVQGYTYSSFGKVESLLDSNFVQPYTFTGRETDPETRLYFYRARSYDPSIGRFLQEDPLRGSMFTPLSQNRYLYVGNQPLNFIDPSGRVLLAISPALGIIGAGISIGYDVLQGRPIDWPQAVASGVTAEITGGPILNQVVASAIISGVQTLVDELTDCKTGVDYLRVTANALVEGVYAGYSPRYRRPDFAKIWKEYKNPYDYMRKYNLLERELAGQQLNTVAYEGLSQGAQRGLDAALTYK